MENIRDILPENNYPTKLIKLLFQEQMAKKTNIDGPTRIAENTAYKENNEEPTTENNITTNGRETQGKSEITKKKHCTIPHINSLTDKIRKCVKEYDTTIKICPKNIKTVKKLYTRVKDKIHPKRQSKLVYEISCKDCNKKYIGMTHRQHLGKRIEQHADDIENFHKTRKKCRIKNEQNIKDEIEKKMDAEREDTQSTKNKNESETIKNLKKLEKLCSKSGITTHHINTGHNLNFTNPRIIEKEENKKKLEIIETLHIKTTDNMNKKEDVNKVKTAYDGILNKN